MASLETLLAWTIAGATALQAIAAFYGYYRLRGLERVQKQFNPEHGVTQGFELFFMVGVLLLFGFLGYTVDILRGTAALSITNFIIYLYIIGIAWTLVLVLIIGYGVKET